MSRYNGGYKSVHLLIVLLLSISCFFLAACSRTSASNESVPAPVTTEIAEKSLANKEKTEIVESKPKAEPNFKLINKPIKFTSNRTELQREYARIHCSIYIYDNCPYTFSYSGLSVNNSINDFINIYGITKKGLGVYYIGHGEYLRFDHDGAKIEISAEGYV